MDTADPTRADAVSKPPLLLVLHPLHEPYRAWLHLQYLSPLPGPSTVEKAIQGEMGISTELVPVYKVTTRPLFLADTDEPGVRTLHAL